MPSWTKSLAADVKEKRLPAPSDRYQSIRSVVDSGFNEIKLKQYLAEQRLHARFQRGENFSRIKVDRLTLHSIADFNQLHNCCESKASAQVE
jgi:hypothetical protein